mmetsp:Transcript_10146/g.30436  ORF Transcript_10146/g.30436 Transcript_10146/m.30436 type:complete len:276 (+) Transcript_10146:1913-2740(+)
MSSAWKAAPRGLSRISTGAQSASTAASTQSPPSLLFSRVAPENWCSPIRSGSFSTVPSSTSESAAAGPPSSICSRVSEGSGAVACATASAIAVSSRLPVRSATRKILVTGVAGMSTPTRSDRVGDGAVKSESDRITPTGVEISGEPGSSRPRRVSGAGKVSAAGGGSRACEDSGFAGQLKSRLVPPSAASKQNGDTGDAGYTGGETGDRGSTSAAPAEGCRAVSGVCSTTSGGDAGAAETISCVDAACEVCVGSPSAAGADGVLQSSNAPARARA